MNGLGNFEVRLQREGASAAVQQLVAELSAFRAGLDREAWKRWCVDMEKNHALNLLMQDPYTRDARLKPAGYAGDARTLDYVYRRTPGEQAVSDLGRSIFAASTGIPVANAVRMRCQHIAEQLQGRRTATSIACGHARELDLLDPELLSGLRFWGLDQDANSIAFCRDRLNGGTYNFLLGSVADVLRGKTRLPESDLVYASGLFDYLDDRVGAALVKRMTAALKPGGRMMVANLTPANEEIAYMEAVMDWWMCYRDEVAMSAMVEHARVDTVAHRVSTYSTSNGRVAWLVVDRLA
jgi:hypothetical protein